VPESREPKRARVLLAEDHTMVRSGVRALLEGARLEVVGEAADGREAIRLAASLRPDLIVLDVAMPLMNGIEAAREIRGADGKVGIIVLSMHGDRAYVTEALRAGASGYVLKSAAFSELLKAVDEVLAGRIYLAPSVSRTALDDYVRRVRDEVAPSEIERLSARERQVLQLIAESKTSAEIGEVLHISPHTVDTHRRKLMEKLEVHNVVDLVKFAIRHGLTSLE
jgi:DNA-binding NarL/FixJ family response regulator